MSKPRLKSHYLPHLYPSHRYNVAALLVARTWRAEVRGDSILTDAPADVVAFVISSTNANPQ